MISRDVLAHGVGIGRAAVGIIAGIGAVLVFGWVGREGIACIAVVIVVSIGLLGVVCCWAVIADVIDAVAIRIIAGIAFVVAGRDDVGLITINDVWAIILGVGMAVVITVGDAMATGRGVCRAGWHVP